MTPEFAAFKQRFDQGRDAGLVAAAAVYHGAIREKLLGGYIPDSQYSHDPGRSGVTAASVQMGLPHAAASGREITVGSNVMHALYWEMGHMNLFTRKYERVEHWRHTLEEQGPAMAAAYGRAFDARIQGGRA